MDGRREHARQVSSDNDVIHGYHRCTINLSSYHTFYDDIDEQTVPLRSEILVNHSFSLFW